MIIVSMSLGVEASDAARHGNEADGQTAGREVMSWCNLADLEQPSMPWFPLDFGRIYHLSELTVGADMPAGVSSGYPNAVPLAYQHSWSPADLLGVEIILFMIMILICTYVYII